MTDPVSWLQIEKGWNVVSADGVLVGKVVEVTGDERDDIFDGLAVKSKQSAHVRYVPGEQVAAIFPGEAATTSSLARRQYAHRAARGDQEPRGGQTVAETNTSQRQLRDRVVARCGNNARLACLNVRGERAAVALWRNRDNRVRVGLRFYVFAAKGLSGSRCPAGRTTFLRFAGVWLRERGGFGKHPSTNAAFAYPDQEKGVEKPLFPSAE